MSFDYAKLGFKSGLEIHSQLDTQHKLFCDCPTVRSEEFPNEIKRKLRAVAGELGEIDVAALLEFEKDLEFAYKSNADTSCLVELDCEPPHELNAEALDVTLQVCKLLDSRVVDEIHIMRKTVIDGSNTSGFQRTALVGIGGSVETSKGPVGITNVQLEEDAATPIEKTGSSIVYRLDRLGIPLIELGTKPEIVDPDHLKETALRIGSLLRITGKSKREIGSIRQDLNVSIRDGARVEIKGAQEPHLFPLIAEREVQRQLTLLEVRGELKKNKACVGAAADLTSLFKESKCNFMRKAPCVMGLALHGFGGVLGKEVQPGRRIGTELSDYAKTGGIGGIVHSDEDLSKYSITEENAIRQRLGLGIKDAFVLVACEQKLARRALALVSKRATLLSAGVPSEVRKALKDGNTSYMRPMPGSARLYPETDCPPVLMTPARLKSVKIHEKPEMALKKLLTLGLSKDLAEKLVNSPNLALFNGIKSKSPGLVASTLVDTVVALRRDAFEVDRLSDKHFVELFQLYEQGLFAKESIPPILEALTLNPGKPVKDVVEALGFAKLSEKQVRQKVKAIAAKNKDALASTNAFSIVMGEVMKELRGKADGGLIAKVVKEELPKNQ
jgi:glutamyl-tRNA(Gln) amidotransferase subunit E